MELYPFAVYGLLALISGWRCWCGHLRPASSLWMALLLAPYAVVLSLPVTWLSAGRVWWCCNSGSYAIVPGNNHFEEDVLFAHFCSTAFLAWILLSALWHRRNDVANVALPLQMLTSGWVCCYVWQAAFYARPHP